jgi:hypothetical protein
MPHDMRCFVGNRSAIAPLARSAIAALLLGSGLARAGDTQIYKTVDAHGNVVYTDRASSANAEKSTVRFHEPSAEDLAHLEQQRKASQAAESQRLQQTAASSIARAQQERAQKDKQARCDNARSYYYSLRDATRVYQLDAQGNRVYLPDSEADAKRTEARSAMEAACAS